MRRRRDNERATASGCRFMRHSGAVVFDWRAFAVVFLLAGVLRGALYRFFIFP